MWMTSCPEAMGWDSKWFWKKSSELRFELGRRKLIFRTWARPMQFVDCGACMCIGWVSELKADDGRTVSIEKLCLSLLVSKNLNLKKVTKVSYLNQESRQCFACFSDSYAYEHFMNIMNVLYIRMFNIFTFWICCREPTPFLFLWGNNFDVFL